jgi:uroporphyrinogen-III synthase
MNVSHPKIILTRPAIQAQPLAQRLTALGYSVALFPLLEIAPLSANSELQLTLQATLADLSRYAMAVFVSPNAIHAVFKNGLVWPTDVPIAVMGEGSRAVLVQYGINEKNTRLFCPTDPFHSDSETLLHELDLPTLQDREVVIFRAETGRELLADALAAHGIHIVKVVAYRRFAPPLTAQTNQLMSELLGTEGHWVVSSSEAIRTLSDMINQGAGEIRVVALQQMNLWVSHRRIAETAEKCGFKHIHLIGSGDENLLHELQSRSINKA